MFKILSLFLLLFIGCLDLQAQSSNPLLIGRVAVNRTHVAFTYAGKIWLVERTGGNARVLTEGNSEETNPVFSPDGQKIAYSRSNGNDWDVYVTSADGKGEARRLTFMGEDDFVTTWTNDGREVVFQSTRDEEGVNRFHKIAVDGGALEESLPLPQAEQGTFSPDGSKIAYNPRNNFSDWRYYRGGLTAPIWITNLKTGAVEILSNQNFNDRFPMWIGDKIYFVSDRTGIYNLFVTDLKTKAVKQLTNFDRQGIRTAAAASDAICFVQNGKLHLFDLANNQVKTIEVSVTPDTSELKARTVPAMRSFEVVYPSASGDKLIFGARGEVLLFDAGSGEAKNLTNTPGVAERFANISPDGKSAAYFSDESGEYALHIRSLGNSSVKKIEIERKPSFYWDLNWSPDSKRLVFSDRRLNLWLADSQNGTAQKIDASTYSAQESWQPNWSPDSRFLTYSKRHKNRAGTVYIYDQAQRKSFQITDGIVHTESPVFDKNGKYLYFISSPNAGTSEYNWGVLNGMMLRSGIVRRVHAFLLTKETISPVLPNGQPNAEAKMSESVSQFKIDYENVSRRFIDLPLPQRDYNRLVAGAAGKLFLVTNDWSETPGAEQGQPRNLAIHHYDLAKLGETQKIVDRIGGAFEITRDGNKILFLKNREWFLISADAPHKADEGKLNLNKMEVRVEPQAEWRQMFHESMRIMRDWFYDPNHHGRNLEQLESEYAAYLPAVTRRADLNRLMYQMLGEVSVSHLGIGGGDAPAPSGGGNRIGLLGADYEITNGHYRFKKIYRSTSFSAANGNFSAPLDQAGLNINEGDYLLEVNGRKLETSVNLYSYFENTVGKPTKIVVSSDAGGTGSRTLTVYPAAGENRLRRANWAENNRKRVEQLSGGKLGYVFIEGYGGEGIMNAIRGLTGYGDKQGVIIDQRFNGGGITPDSLIEWMQRKPLYHYAFRGGDDIATPVNPAPPVKVMIINEFNGSAAETAAFMFKLGKVGALVGKRTMGAGIGPYFYTPRFIDGGRVQLPNRAAYNPDGSGWGIENYGVEPEYDVEITSQDLMAGRDSQLEKAVEVAMAQIVKNPTKLPKRPVFPVHPGKQDLVQGKINLPMPGSAYPAPIQKNEVKSTGDGKFSAFIGHFETPMGVMSFQQEENKFIGIAGSGERIELIPDATVKDKFVAQTANVQITFERDTSGKVIGLTIIIPSGKELKGKKLIN